MNKRLIRITAGIGTLLILLTAVFFLTGLYVIPDYQLATSCDVCIDRGPEQKAEVLWYWRAGQGTPFLSSDGGILMKLNEEGIPFLDRLDKTVELRSRIREATFAHLPPMDFLYPLTAEGRKPVKFDPAF